MSSPQWAEQETPSSHLITVQMTSQVGIHNCEKVCFRHVSNLFGVIVHHAGGVINSQADLVVSLAGFGPPQPDLIFTELTGDVGYHLSHVQSLPCAVVASVKQ